MPASDGKEGSPGRKAALPDVGALPAALMVAAFVAGFYQFGLGETAKAGTYSKGFQVIAHFVRPDAGQAALRAEPRAESTAPVVAVVAPVASSAVAAATRPKNKRRRNRTHDDSPIHMNPRLIQCEPLHRSTAPAPPGHVYLGCFGSSEGPAGSGGEARRAYSSDEGYRSARQKCLQACKDGKASRTHIFAHLLYDGTCRCRASFGGRDTALAQASCAWPCAKCTSSRAQQVYRVGPWMPALPTKAAPVPGVDTVTIFLWANPRLAAIFRTCRLAQYSGRFTYDVYDVRHQVRNENKVHVAELFRRFPGPKIIVFDGCCVPGWLIMDWPAKSLLVIASDESARWGFANSPESKKKAHFFGPHGPDELVPSDSQYRILMPEGTKPWFKQYFSIRHNEHFGNEMRYMPLGSREEFEAAPPSYLPPSQRKYVYSFMVAPTDDGRKKVRDILVADKLISKNRTFLHVAEHWDADPNSDRNTYIKPAQYRQIMLDSVFTICPKGHSIEQFRFYEAIESGSIPIMAMEGHCPGGCPTYASERLPPEYLRYPVVVVQDWDALIPTMIKLEANQTALLQRQLDLRGWYRTFMHGKISEMEDALIAKF